MDNMFNFEIFCESLDRDLNDDIYLTQMNNQIIIREDLIPFSTRGRYAKQLLLHLNKMTGSDKFVYISRWFDSTQLALAYFCKELNYKLLIVTDATDRTNNVFSEVAKTLGTKVKYGDVLLKDVYIKIPTELEHEVSMKVLEELFRKLQGLNFQEAWFTVEESVMIPKVFKQIYPDCIVNIVFVCEEIPSIDFECNKILSKLKYYQSCEPYYPPYYSNVFIDGKLYYHTRQVKDKKILVFNKY